MTFQWDYACARGRDCSFVCRGSESVIHVTKLTIYLGSIPVGNSQKYPAVFYDFSTIEIARGNGFSVSAGIGELSCQIHGMTLLYSGPPK